MGYLETSGSVYIHNLFELNLFRAEHSSETLIGPLGALPQSLRVFC